MFYTLGLSESVPKCCVFVGWHCHGVDVRCWRKIDWFSSVNSGSDQTIVRAVTKRQKLEAKLSMSPSHSILTPGRPVPALTVSRQSPCRVGIGVTGMTRPLKKSRNKRDSNPGSSALESDASTTSPTRRSVNGRDQCLA